MMQKRLRVRLRSNYLTRDTIARLRSRFNKFEDESPEEVSFLSHLPGGESLRKISATGCSFVTDSVVSFNSHLCNFFLGVSGLLVAKFCMLDPLYSILPLCCIAEQ